MNPFDEEFLHFLESKGIVTEAEAHEFREIHKEVHLSIPSILLAQSKFSTKQLSEFLTEFTGISILPFLKDTTFDASLFELLPKEFCVGKQVVPLKQEGSSLQVAMASPHYKNIREEIAFMTDFEPQIFLADSDTIAALLEQTSFHAGMDTEAGDNRIIQLVQNIISFAYEKKASDIHIEPAGNQVRLRYRIDGVLVDIPGFNIIKEELPALISRIKIMSGMDIAEKRLPQDGRILYRDEKRSKDIDIRVSVIPSMKGEAVVMRILDRDAVLMNLSALGFSRKDLKLIRSHLSKTHGMIILTGPTGSGKTTTLYAMLSEVNTPEKKILTIEDPVEYQIDGIEQVQTHAEIGLTFAEGLRSFLRHDPDVIMVGEIRDEETAEIAVRSSLTGHLVLSTLHTNDSTSAATRLVDMKVKPYLAASTLSLVISQRLVRKLCENCKRKVRVKAEKLKEYGIFGKIKAGSFLYEPVGCRECNQTGYKGRLAIFETLSFDDKIRQAIVEEKSASEIRKMALKSGLKTLLDSGLEKVKKGFTSLEEVFRVTHDF
ncbi:MAG: type II/IV secretion system protein [Candidatus Hydrogenedentota bacterium]|nr:MAG: type II/IV secretion system protein [Candidatus Hydrogenedentota bacterium]